MTTGAIEIVLWCAVLVASIVGLALRDVRAYGVTLFAALVAILLAVVPHVR